MRSADLIAMKFVIAIEPGNDFTAYGMVVPDLPGCFSAGDTLEQAFHNAREAIAAHCELIAECIRPVPQSCPRRRANTGAG